MHDDELDELLSNPAFLRKVLNGFQGPFSLGVAGSDELILSVEETAHQFPPSVEVDGQRIRVKVNRAWKQAQPL